MGCICDDGDVNAIAMNRNESVVYVSSNVIGILFIALSFYLVVMDYETLPDRVPRHFNLKGEVDGYSAKQFVWVLPSISLVMFLFLSLVMRAGSILKQTETTNERQLANTKLTLCVIKAEVAGLFTYLTFEIIQVAKGISFALSNLFFPLITLLILGTVAIMLYRNHQLRTR